MRRRLFTSFAELSLVLWITSVVLLLVSANHEGTIYWLRARAWVPQSGPEDERYGAWTGLEFKWTHGTYFLAHSLLFSVRSRSPVIGIAYIPDADQDSWGYTRFGPPHMLSPAPELADPWRGFGCEGWACGPPHEPRGL